MRRITIDYGIDLGTTNSAICRIDHGVPEIIHTDYGSETMPSCVSFKKDGVVRIGQSAFSDLEKDKLRALKRKSSSVSNSFIEFKRFMGSDSRFSNINVTDELTPEDLSAKVISKLCSFVTDDEVKAAVITVPAKFTVNQKNATLAAARLAGIEQVELLQEPIAASMAYGLKAEEKNGIWMVFDFGGGTLDVALVNVCDGVMQVFDTEGDNYLGGKNIDEIIVSKILLPKIASSFAVNLTDSAFMQIFKDALKVEAERLKNKLSFSESETIYLEAGDWGEDEDGEEIDMEITVSRTEMERVIRPILQKAVDVCKTLMMRNDITFGRLSHLILIGGPTNIPLLRTMLREQITPNVETSINPMTAVSKGAAIYASTLPLKVKTKDLEHDVLRLDIDFDSTSVETNVAVPVKASGNTGLLEVVFIRRSDGWKSEPAVIGERGGIAELELLENMPNVFRIETRQNGDVVGCSPAEMTIVHGFKAGCAILPYNFGIEVFNPNRDRNVFTVVDGLNKNRPLPAKGFLYGLKTQCDIRPGKEKDRLRIPIYQGDDNAEGKPASLFEYISDVEISGDDIASFIPKGSVVNIQIQVDRSEMMVVLAEFTDSGQKVSKELDTSRRQAVRDSDYLWSLISQAKSLLNRLEEVADDLDEIKLLYDRLAHVGEDLRSESQHKQVEQHLKEILREIDDIDTASEWNRAYKPLKSSFFKLQIEAIRCKDSGVNQMVEEINRRIEAVAKTQNRTKAKELKVEIDNFAYALGEERYYRDFINYAAREFSAINWCDKKRAKRLTEEAFAILRDDPNASLSKIKAIADQINALIKPKCNVDIDGVLEKSEVKQLPKDLLSM